METKKNDSSSSSSQISSHQFAVIAQENGESYFGKELSSSSSSSSSSNEGIHYKTKVSLGCSPLDSLGVPLFSKGSHSPALEDWSLMVNAAFDTLATETSSQNKKRCIRYYKFINNLFFFIIFFNKSG
jgi:hypothetical protein